MAQSFEKFNRRRLRSSYFSVTISIALVLFLLGLLGMLVINANELARQVRESFELSVNLSADAGEADVRELQKSLELRPEVRATEFIPKEQAAEDLQEDLGEDFVDFLGYNPLQDVIVVRLTSDFVEQGGVKAFEDELMSNALVQEVVYDPDLLELINENIKKIGIFLIGGALLLLLVSIALINSSIRLSIYSRRFLIKTMQLVGATRGFIQKPFMWQSMKLGLMGGIIASLLLSGLFIYLRENRPDLGLFTQPLHMGIIAAGLLITGVILAWLSTFFAVNKYLKLKTDELYF
ncbi:MAG: permease-like cell division protein FtsX [Bacteroidota bacterium]|mgnify:CR=1 FL=1|nr:permease-like cell division protein FtsX [Bacteroidota bacterium]MDX5404236.1 permease-like cell division protein FtsX [Bacteroidota bacterium]MDX5428802.1 permease-like cell division protein FtsX [Bacteroidota bacterium]MDX5447041.1 permease-like cell division protein FtsX [Bacteroidota bacterium]MDX5506501.1 permease-like cell division protein FtsX [Bacteroidota bacterium]